MLHGNSMRQSERGSVPRRSVLKAGFLTCGGLGLAELLRLRSDATEAGAGTRKTSVIFIELAGGPSQFETYDPKPDAPLDYRGPLGAIRTNVPGLLFSELMVEQAKIMDKLAIVRSVHHDSSSHGTSKHLIQTGYYKRTSRARENEMPSIGSITAKVRGANAATMPPYVCIPETRSHGNTGYGRPAYLGMAYQPLEIKADPNDAGFQVKNLALAPELNLQRLTDRRDLTRSLDVARRVLDSQGAQDSMTRFSEQAFDIVAGQRARLALDMDREDAQLREQYGRSNFGQNLLLARRLVEAGVTLVTVRGLYWDQFPKPAGRKPVSWDHHSALEKTMRLMAPGYDQGVAALVRDLHERGLDRDVLVVAMGEFGRTPRMNADAGRDHWGDLMSVLFAGGGVQGGNVIGTSSRYGEFPTDAPCRPENVLSTMYRHLGIDPALMFSDPLGRPHHILQRQEPIAGLL